MEQAGISALEAGPSGLELGGWYGLLAPANTPEDVVEKLNQSINAALMNPALHGSMAKLAFVPPRQPNTPAAFKEMIAEETERWTGILQTRNIKQLD